MRSFSFLISCLVLTAFFDTGCSLAQSGARRPGALRIRAFIDGSDTIKIRGNDLWYEHHKWDLPGKWQGRFDEPTYVNGKAWKPQWHGSVSGPYQEVHPAFPRVTTEQIKLTKLAGRGSVSITETPNRENDYTLSVFLDDDRFAEAEWYEMLIEW